MGLVNSETERLKIPFLEEEVFATLSDLGKDKAPSSDGFNMAFWFFCWDVMKVEVMGVFRDFHEIDRFIKSLNVISLVLVPNKGSAKDLEDFRPISLVGNRYKLLAKVFANRIKKVMDKVISESQNSFVEGRQILYVVLITNEVVDSRLKNNESGVLCKLDIEKAYDHVNWKFLMAVLRKMGFGEKWIKWIDRCISIVKFFVLINGSETSRFSPSLFVRDSHGGI